MKHEAAKKTLARVVCVLFIIVTLLSVTFVLTHTHHEHDHDGPGGNCAACVHLTVAGNVLKLLAGAFVCAAFGAGKFTAVRSAVRVARFHAALSTPVQKKVKLNN